jgi:hypothetical protein
LLVAVVLLVEPFVVWRTSEAAYRSEVAAFERDRRQERFKVNAVLLADAAAYFHVDGDAAATQDPVPARWTAPDGTPRTGKVVPSGLVPAGSVAVIWTDAHGDRTDPLASAHPTGMAVATGLMMALSLGIGSVCLLLVLRRRLNKRRMAEWQMEWLFIEPRWSGRR